MILTDLPDLPPRPLTARVAAFRRDFYRRWGRELWGLEDYDATRIFKFHKSFVYYSSKVDYTALSTILKGNTPALTADDVIATDVAADGKVTVYYWKKSSDQTKTP